MARLNPDRWEVLLGRLRAHNAGLEAAGEWPSASWDLLREAGILKWFVPADCGGEPVEDAEIQAGYLRLASACLTVTFILTQRNAAVARIAISRNVELRGDLLRRLAEEAIFATVGISHLTTSRQHLAIPAVQAIPVSGGWRFRGEVPWVTGAARADVIVTGGVQPDDRQVLVALERTTPGVRVQPPPRLLALNESWTATVTLDDVFVAEERLLLGPEENVLKAGGAGGLTTSSLALGSALNSIRGLEAEAGRREALREPAANLRETFERLQDGLLALAARDEPAAAEELETLRRHANALALNAAQAWLSASKGAGFLASHPASRAIREAQFFQVWSCPQDVLTAALQAFACAGE